MKYYLVTCGKNLVFPLSNSIFYVHMENVLYSLYNSINLFN